jgi:FkbH-like protein
LDEKSFWDWASEAGHAAFTFQVSDRFGDLGLTGLATLSYSGTQAQIVDFVMSCRAMGKKVEEALLGYLVEQAQSAGANRVKASPVDGPRNGPAKDFFATKFADGESVIDPSRVGIPAQISLLARNLETESAV